MPKSTATLLLKDGTTIQGESFGADITSAGEVVFNTGMMGYPESFTDPSYAGQILVLTYPLIGNYGIPPEEFFESDRPHIRGLIVSEYSENFSHWQARQSLGSWLKKHKIPAITGVDTRALTQLLRQHGTMLGKILPQTGKTGEAGRAFHDPNLTNLVAEVSIKKPILYKNQSKTSQKRIIAVDCGMKNNILRKLLARDLTVLRTPWDYDFIEARDNQLGETNQLAQDATDPSFTDFDGIFLSNGPGDPASLTFLIEIIRKAITLKKPVPIFGICLGNQILALAAGATTYKLKFGHRAQNQPVQDVDPTSPAYRRCYITSQNHGFAIKDETLPSQWRPWLKNLNDDTNEGIRHASLPFFSCQFHPEAAPGPTDTNHFFDKFVEML